MKTATKSMTKWLVSFAVALLVVMIVLLPQVLKIDSEARAQNPSVTYTPNTSWYSSAGTYTLDTPEKLLGFFQLLANGTTFKGSTIKLGCSIDLNPGWNLNLGATSSNAAVFPTAPPNKIYIGDKIYNNNSTGRWFFGTFDGQGYVIRGIYSDYTYNSNGCLNATSAGIFGNICQDANNYATIQNVIIQNSYLQYSNSTSTEGGMGGICGCLRGSAKIQNCYFDVDLAMRANNAGSIGAICGYGGSVGTTSPTLSNVVWAGTMGHFKYSDSAIVNNGRLGLVYQNANTNYCSVSNVLNMGILFTGLSANETSGYSIKGKSPNGFTCTVGTHVYGNFAINAEQPNKQTSSLSGWTYMPAFESYFPSNVANLQGFVKNGSISDLKSAVETAARNSGATAYGVPGVAEGSTYLISTADDLMKLGDLVHYCDADGTNHRWWLSGMYFKLANDIDLNAGWEAKVEWSGTQFKIASVPTNKWAGGDAPFAGILDGDGHTISGLYSAYLLTNPNQNKGGLFGILVNGNEWNASGNISAIRCGRVCNLAITNSMAVFMADASSNRGGGRLGGVCGLLRTGGAAVENCYIDMELWHDGYGGCYMGAVGGFTEDNDHKVRSSVKNVTVSSNTRIGSVGGNSSSIVGGTWYGTTTSTVTFGGIVGQSRRTNYTDTLFLGSFCRNGSAGYTNNFICNTSNDTTSGSNVATTQGSAPNGNWTSKSFLGSFTPGSIVPNRYAVIGSNVAISNYGTYYDYGSSFTIGSYSDYNTFVNKIASDSAHDYGAGMTFKLTADINANADWNAIPEVAFDTTACAGSATFPAAPGNLWSQCAYFRGTFDGQGHVIAGMYIGASPTGHGQKFGMFKELGNNAVVKNLIITNSAMLINTAGWGSSQIGGIVGNISGSYVTLENIYSDLNIWSKGNYNTFMGGFVGHTGSGGNFYLTNLVFAGTLGQTKNSASNTELEIPVTVTDGYMSQLIAHSNYKTTYHLNNIILVGERYSNYATLHTQSPYAWSAATDPDSGTYKLFTDAHNIILTKKTASTIASGDCVTPPSGSNTYQSGVSWTKGTKTSGNVIIDFYMPSALATYVNAATFPRYLPVEVSITARTGSETPGSVYTISSAAEFLKAAELSRGGVTFAGYTLKLTADIDLNPNWTGSVTVTGGNRATLPNLPVNTFQGFGDFAGTFDGRNYYVSGIFMMAMITSSSVNIAPIARLTGNGTIRNVKFINGLIYAQENYAVAPANDSEFRYNRISGLIGEAVNDGGSKTISNVYSSMNVWYNGRLAQYMAGFVSVLTDAAPRVSLTISNCTFAGVVGTYYQSGANNVVPSTSTGTVVSQFVAHGGWSTNLKLDSYNMNGTTYISGSATTPAAVTAASNATTTNAGTATAVSKVYVSPIDAAFSSTLYAGELSATYEGAHDTYIYYYIHLTKAANYDAFGSKLTAGGYTGYTKVQEYNIGDNWYALWTNPAGFDLYVSFLATGGNSSEGKGRGSVFVAPAGMAYNATKTASEASGTCTAQIWQLDVDNAYSQANGGMSYVIRLTNGHFIIIDGGYYSNYDARNLYKTLKENNVLGGNPIVDAWFITHLHEDHFGALRRFATNYASDVTVNAFYYNFPSDAVGAAGSPDEAGYASTGISNSDVFAAALAMAAWPNAARYGKVHSGQTFGFTGLTATILATHEDVKMKYSSNGTEGGFTTNDFYDGNDTSLVIKFTFFPGTTREQTFMVTGDASSGESNVLLYNYASSVLKSDIIQVSHHGFKGLTSAVYNAMNKTNASVYLWPQDFIQYTYSNDTWGKNGSDSDDSSLTFGYLYKTSNFSGVNSTIKSLAKEVIPADKNVCLTMPYRANTNYSSGYWTKSKTDSVQSTKWNTQANRDGSASGLSADSKWTIRDWWSSGAYSTYSIDSIQDFYEFTRLSLNGQTFSGKTINLAVNLTLSDFDGNMFTGANGAWAIPSGVSTWTPLPTFSGIFDGNNHTISGIYSNINQGSSGTLGGFIKTLSGGTIRNLTIKNSAFICTNTAENGSADRIYGGIVGESTGTSALTNCLFDVNVYYKSNYVNSSAGVVANVSGGTLNMTNVELSGEVGQVSEGGVRGTNITIASGQQMRGVNGILGYSKGVTTSTSRVNLTNVRFTGTRYRVQNESNDRSADLYYTYDTNNIGTVSGCVGGTDRGTATPPSEGTSGGVQYVYSPQLDKVVSAENSLVTNPIYQQVATSGGTKNVRFVGTITREAAKRALALGFRLTVTRSSDSKVARYSSEQFDVYSSVTANGSTVKAADLGGDYIYAMVLKGLPTSDNVTYTINVETLFEEQDGTQHWGAPVTMTIRNGVVQ